MPRLTGLELVKKFLAIKPDLSVILCSGYSEDLSDEILKKAGVKEFLLKPINMELLVNSVRKALDR